MSQAYDGGEAVLEAFLLVILEHVALLVLRGCVLLLQVSLAGTRAGLAPASPASPVCFWAMGTVHADNARIQPRP